MRQKRVYLFMNSIIILISVMFFAVTYKDKINLVLAENNLAMILLLVTVVLVNLCKCARLYFALYGTEISIEEHVKQYCKTVPVSILIPLKAGDIFRAYCYGYQMQNYLKAFIIILLDRFVDTLALVAITFFIIVTGSEVIPALFYLLLLFLMLLILGYYIFPGLYSYWNDYFIRNKASVRRNSFLKLMSRCNMIYVEISKLIKGRCLFLYCISVLAWSVEIGGMVCIKKILLEDVSMQMITDYLNSALGISDSIFLQRFVFFSVVLMIGFYLPLYVRKIVKERKL